MTAEWTRKVPPEASFDDHVLWQMSAVGLCGLASSLCVWERWGGRSEGSEVFQEASDLAEIPQARWEAR